MRALLRLILCLLPALAATAAHAQWTTAPVSAPGVQYRLFQSASAGTTVSFHIYLPPQYAAQPQARFPVLYWLHGSGDGTLGIPWLSNYFSTAMAQGRIPPMLVVYPNGMTYSMWCDSKSGAVPMESVVLDDLIPHVDANFRTVTTRRGRILEGFSMGGQGAGRLGFRRPDLFGGVSMLGAGPIQLDFLDAPDNSTTPPKLRLQIYENVWGSDPAYYLAQHPWTIVEDRAAAVLAAQTVVRQALGSLDALVPMNDDFDAHLDALGIPHAYTVIPGVGHQPSTVLSSLGEANWAFYNAVFTMPCPQPADLDCSGAVDGADLATVLASWGPGHGPADIDGDGLVGGADLAGVLTAWGPVP
ncbi:MAG: alpha/beta hydrolase-fold protein [Planctomycetota bacterium]